MSRHHLKIIASAVAVLALAGCSADSGAGTEPDGAPAAPAAAGPFNAADIEFATTMIPHEQQVVDMAALAGERAAAPEVARFALRLRDGQDPVIARMSALLESWGQPAPADPGLHLTGPAEASGMLTPEEMAELQGLSAEAFDSRFLELTERHHQGAIDLAAAQRTAGTSPQAREIADGVTEARQREIAEVRDLRAN
ncbi:DUF305 domain-containing protein [Amycolatopsis antarctica]|uniref:DUF305 domain-containing protein n=1 Tax=Amycolatopsis antarctica TaxID=1854586 RepID=A0A263DA48_9PSEU|nr:DUF305 domain-containing protein [Amycolatopsis antarctica]OZM74407.1 DUF305 domain-containing protein [Amycolatopsis antarctica]